MMDSNYNQKLFYINQENLKIYEVIEYGIQER